MDRRWYKVWPLWAPKTIEVDKPVSEYIREWAAMTPDGIALSFYGRDIRYAELNGMIDRAAWGLANLGVKKGDRVAVHMENCPQFVIAYFAVHRAGGVVVAVNPMLKGLELEFEMNDAGIETLIGIDALYSEVEKIKDRTPLKNVILTSMKDFLPLEPALTLPEELKHEKRYYPNTMDLVELMNKSQNTPICHVTDMKTEVALLQYTGGTTGTPKGAMISHYSLSIAALGHMHWFHYRENDVFLGVTPFFHAMGQAGLMATPLSSGGRVVILTRFVPDVVAEAITRYRCTFWVGPTTMMIALLNLPNINDYDFSSFRCLWTGGTPVSVELQNRLKELAPRAVIGEGYGLTETMSQGAANTPLFRYKPGFVGIPQINVDIKIVDQETGREVGPNEVGEIVIKSSATMLGYWNNPEGTKEMLRDGWLYSGDTGLMDEEGYIKFLGRARDLIKCSGYSVFPTEVENLLYCHPAIKEVAVIGVDDPYRGESPKAFVILKEEFTGKVREEEILGWCKENMAAYKRPRFIEFRADLPKSNAGKVLRRTLVEEEKSKGASK